MGRAGRIGTPKGAAGAGGGGAGSDTTAIHTGDAAGGALAGTYPNPTLVSVGGTPAPVLSTSNVAGNATTYLRTNDQLALFDATAPSLPTNYAAAGTAAFAARRDHQHQPAISSGGMRISDDFMYNAAYSPASLSGIGPLMTSFSGTNALLTFQPIANPGNHPGIASFGTGTTSTGSVYLTSGSAAILLGAGRMRYGLWVNIPVVSTSLQRFEVNVGFLDNTTAAGAVDGAFFSYLDTVNSGAWSVTTVSNSTKTATDNVTTGTTMTAANWYLLEAEVNAAGTSVTYYINGVSTGVTHTSNIPTGVGRETGFRMNMTKTIGTTSSLLYVDGYYVEQDFTTPR